MPFFDKLKSTFQSTPSAALSRNDLMVEEVRKFAQEIKAFHKEYLGLSQETQRRLAMVSTMLDKPLPRIFQNGSTGAQPAEDIRRIGLIVPTSSIDTARTELETRLQKDVMGNLERWVEDYRTIKAAHRENLRLLGMVNDQRRTVAICNEKYQKLAQKDMNLRERDAAQVKAKNEEEKYREYQQRYVQREQEVYDQLVQLIKRSALFKDGIAMSLRIFQGAFSASYQSFEDAHAAAGLAAPMPPRSMSLNGYTGPGYQVAEPDEYKRMGSRNGSLPALPAPTSVAGAGSPPEYAPRPVDPYAQPAHYGAPAIDAPSFRRTSSPGASSGSGTAASSQAGGYPVKGSGVPSAQEMGSQAWVETTKV